MGSGIIVKCSRCDFSKELLIGSGLFKPSFEKALEISSEETKETLKKLLNNYRIENHEVVREIYYCTSCLDIVDKSVLKVDLQSGIKFEEELYCSNCNNKLEKVEDNEEIHDLHCPNCEESTLTYIENYISWD